MFDFLLTHNYTENPTAFGIMITVMCTFLLSSMVAMVYQWTTPTIEKSDNFMQSMVLLSIVAAMVIQAIGDSLARGLGMLGALAIIRFRTKLDNPRNIAFVFAALANGIACGVYGFTIAFIGSTAFCAAAIIFRFSQLGTKDILVGSLKFSTSLDKESITPIREILTKHCKKHKLLSERYANIKKTKTVKNEKGAITDRVKVDITKEYNYQLLMKNEEQSRLLAESLDTIEDISDIRLRFGESETKL